MTADVDRKPAEVDPSRTVLYGVVGLTAVSFGGAMVSLSGGLSRSLLEAMGPSGRLSVPLPMAAFQLATALAAGSRRRQVALTGSGLLLAAQLAALVSGFFDGGYADDRLTRGQRAYQLVLVGALSGVGVLAAARFRRAWRPAPQVSRR